MNPCDIYFDGMRDALKFIERGVAKGVTVEQSIECLKIAIDQTEFDEIIKRGGLKKL